MNKLNNGDRVEFVENYSSAMTGDKGTVTASDSTLVYVKLDKGNTAACYPYRLKLIEAALSETVFKKGDTVRIVRIVPKERGWTNTWAVKMDATVGTTFVVRDISATGVRGDSLPYGYPTSSLELVKAAPTQPAAPAPKAPPVFKVGDKGLTRAGYPYEVLMVREGFKQPILAAVTPKGEPTHFRSSNANGSHFEGSFVVSDYDLMVTPKTATVYLNIRADGKVSGSYTDEGDARRFASSLAVVVAHPVTVELP